MALRYVSAAGGGGKRVLGVRLHREREHDPRHHERLRPGGGHRPRLRHPGRGGPHPAQRIGEAPWMAELSRRVQHYGWRYDYRGASRPVPAAPFPRWAAVMADRLRERFGGAAPGAVHRQRVPPRPRHRDARRPRRFRAGRGVALSRRRLADAVPPPHRAPLRPRRASGDEVAVLPRRSVLVLAGPARTAWMHGIDRDAGRRRRATRISATFRTLASGAGRP